MTSTAPGPEPTQAPKPADPEPAHQPVDPEKRHTPEPSEGKSEHPKQ